VPKTPSPSRKRWGEGDKALIWGPLSLTVSPTGERDLSIRIAQSEGLHRTAFHSIRATAGWAWVNSRKKLLVVASATAARAVSRNAAMCSATKRT